MSIDLSCAAPPHKLDWVMRIPQCKYWVTARGLQFSWIQHCIVCGAGTQLVRKWHYSFIWRCLCSLPTQDAFWWLQISVTIWLMRLLWCHCFVFFVYDGRTFTLSVNIDLAGVVSQRLFWLLFFHSIGAWAAQWIFRWKDCVLRSSYRRMQIEILWACVVIMSMAILSHIWVQFDIVTSSHSWRRCSFEPREWGIARFSSSDYCPTSERLRYALLEGRWRLEPWSIGLRAIVQNCSFAFCSCILMTTTGCSLRFSLRRRCTEPIGHPWQQCIAYSALLTVRELIL